MYVALHIARERGEEVSVEVGVGLQIVQVAVGIRRYAAHIDDHPVAGLKSQTAAAECQELVCHDTVVPEVCGGDESHLPGTVASPAPVGRVVGRFQLDLQAFGIIEDVIPGVIRVELVVFLIRPAEIASLVGMRAYAEGHVKVIVNVAETVHEGLRVHFRPLAVIVAGVLRILDAEAVAALRGSLARVYHEGRGHHVFFRPVNRAVLRFHPGPAYGSFGLHFAFRSVQRHHIGEIDFRICAYEYISFDDDALFAFRHFRLEGIYARCGADERQQQGETPYIYIIYIHCHSVRI